MNSQLLNTVHSVGLAQIEVSKEVPRCVDFRALEKAFPIFLILKW